MPSRPSYCELLTVVVPGRCCATWTDAGLVRVRITPATGTALGADVLWLRR